MRVLNSPVLLLLAVVLSPAASYAATSTQVLGWSEQAVLSPDHAIVKAELDTSTQSSSLMAGHIEPFQRDGEAWVRFTLQVPKAITGTLVDMPFERKVLRTEKSKGVIGGSGHRQVVNMSFCIGKQQYTAPLSLKSQGKKNFVLVLGRDLLPQIGRVDASLVDTVKPDCSN